MRFCNPFNYLPILGTYRLTYYKAVVLRAPPTILRLCVIIEVLVALGVFIVAYYFTATTATKETVVSFEVLGGDYSCTVLSPRSDTQIYNDATSEIAAFSSARFNYATCVSTLGSGGYDVCSDSHRQDYILTLTGFGSGAVNGGDCKDVILAEDYRFCSGSDSVTDLRNSAETLMFPTYPSYQPLFKSKYFFMNSSGDATIVGDFPSIGGGGTTVALSPFITDFSSRVFVVAGATGSSNSMLYMIDRTSANPQPLASVGSSNIYGFTYGDNKVFTWTIDNGMARLFTYDTVTKQQQASGPYDCLSSYSAMVDVAASSHFLNYGSDGMLYAMCSGTVKDNRAYSFSFLQINTLNKNAVQYNANVSSLFYISTQGTTTSAKINRIGQVFRAGQHMYFTATNNFNNLLYADMTAPKNQNQNISKIANYGMFPGDYAIPVSSRYIYFVDSGNQTYFDTSSKTFKGHYPSASATDNFLARKIQLAFSYQICNGNYSNYQVHMETSGSFAALCGEKNGIYYQKNMFFDVPESCVGYISKVHDASRILECPAVKIMQDQFVSSNCSNSFTKVCESEYTDNPPFSCSRDVYPNFLTVIGTAIADSSGAWSVIVMIMQLILKVFYPHGTIDFDFDESVNRFLPLPHAAANNWHHAKMQILPEETLDGKQKVEKDERDQQLLLYENVRDIENGRSSIHQRR